MKTIDHKSIVTEIINKLPNGEYRFSLSKYPLSYACLGNYDAPHMGERITSDYGVTQGNEEIERDFFEEINLIEKILEELNFEVDLAKWQSKTKFKSMEKLYTGLNRRSVAIQFWDNYAIPWRFKDGNIHIIWSPTDVMGKPIMHTFSVQDFLAMHSRLEANRMLKVNELIKKYNLWRWIGSVALIVMFAVIIWKY